MRKNTLPKLPATSMLGIRVCEEPVIAFIAPHSVASAQLPMYLPPGLSIQHNIIISAVSHESSLRTYIRAWRLPNLAFRRVFRFILTQHKETQRYLTMSSQYFKITEHTVDTQHIRQYPHATINGQEEVLKLAVKQYTPLDNPNPRPGDVTILAAHANGFPKVCV